MRPRKSLGQHFLINQTVAHQIVDAVKGQEVVVEVGPGSGVLTKLLSDRCAHLILIEKDDRFAADLERQFANHRSVDIIHDDFLKVDLAEVSGGESFSLVGNFPYNISSQIVFRMLEYKALIPEMVGMFQLEMAQRILAGTGSKAYSVIGVLTQTAYTGELVLRVPPRDFRPPPKVMSGVIRLERLMATGLPCDPSTLRAVVKAAFGKRRKMLRNSLRSLIPADAMSGELFNRRPEHVSLETFYMLARLAEEYKQSQKE